MLNEKPPQPPNSFREGPFEIKRELRADAAIMAAAGMNPEVLDYAAWYIDFLERKIDGRGGSDYDDSDDNS